MLLGIHRFFLRYNPIVMILLKIRQAFWWWFNAYIGFMDFIGVF